MAITLFDYINMISQTKEIPEFDAHFEKTYSPFVVNRFFSLFKDNSVIIANTLNRNCEISKKNHFLFLHSMIRRSKRFSKWPKKNNNERINFLMEVFNYSHKRAKEASMLITDEQITELHKADFKGGIL